MEETSKKVRQREIRFRAWVTGSERMVYDPYHFEFYHYSDENRVNQKTYRIYETWRDLEDGTALNCELMQCTGLKDKNGRDIFEGDVIQAIGSEGSKIRHEIIFDDGGFCAKNITYQNIGKLTQKWIHELEFEIIGNIYEPPHLLSQGEIKTELI